MSSKKKSLAKIHPEIAKQWHPSKNGDLTPYDVTFGSDKRVWWKCEKGDDHEWQINVYKRSSGTGCPICSGKIIVVSNCLASVNAKLASEWHPTKNGELTPYDVTHRCNKKVWWKCPKGGDHEWESVIYNRSIIGTGCLICSNRKVVTSNMLSTTHPELAKQWHPTKNSDLTPNNITAGFSKRIWWKCDKGDDHVWITSIANRLNKKTSCPYCSGRRSSKSNSLSVKYPKIAKQWHPTKNGNLTPNDITFGSGKNVWWKCDKGDDHEWISSIVNRTKGNGCSVCYGKTVVKSNMLSTTRPELAKQWHPTKNGNLTPNDITFGSGKNVWWKCDKGDDHEWISSIVNRTKGRNCPFCTLTPQSKQELTITFELIKIFKNIDPKGLKTRLDGQLRAIDIFIPKLNLCVEFDGAYWHKDKRDIDKIKSEMLFEEGFKLIRVREEPLKKIYDTDVISKQPYNGKQVTNDILSMILSIFELEAKLVSKIKAYQSKDGLQNEKGLDKYIDKILTEKVKKNGNI